MKLKFFALLSIFFWISFPRFVQAGEPLIKYNYLYITDPATGLRLKDGDPVAVEGIVNQQKFKIGRPFAGFALDPNSPQIGNPDDCYPDNPNNPEGNIMISGRIISNFTNKPVNGAVVAIYMGAEQQGNFNAGFGFTNEKFIHGGKDGFGRLTNLYTYDITKDGYYRVYACNAYKQLSQARLAELKKFSPNIFDNPAQPCFVDGYSGNSSGCTTFDYTKVYPKFSLSVICGLANTKNSDKPAPQVGEILSIDNYNNEYKSANPPSYMYKNNMDIRVNCGDNLPPFPVPLNMDYKSGNTASCRMDDISPTLRNYYSKVQSNLKNDFASIEQYTVPGSSLIPDDSSLTCSNPDDILCLKNFLTKSFEKPELGKNIFDYGNKIYLDQQTANPDIVDKTLNYVTIRDSIRVDLSTVEESSETGRSTYIPLHRNSEEGQLDAKFEMKSYVSDYQFDLNILKDLYSCFTTFNAPANRSNALIDEQSRNRFATGSANVSKEFYANNLRIPTCRELYCGSEFIPDNNICKVKKPDVAEREKYGFDFSVSDKNNDYYQINALSGYGPGITLNFRSIEDITNDLMVLSKQLIASDFNPKKSIPGTTLLYKPVQKISDIVACLDDDENPVYLNDGTTQKEGSITYKHESQEKTFFSPVPLLSFISVPYQMKLFNSIEGDNYANVKKSGPSPILFPEQCNEGSVPNSADKTQTFANCRNAVIPGGVYSVSALRVIAKYCAEVFKIPTPDAANLPMGEALTSSKQDSKNNTVFGNKANEVDLSVTKVGTPLSLCLCSVDDKDCNNLSKLNNRENTNDFAVSSFVGAGNQNVQGGKSYNVLGAKCNNSQQVNNPEDPHKPVANCQGSGDTFFNKRKFASWTVENTPEFNYIGDNRNLKTNWAFSWDELASDEAHQYITYQYTGNEPPKDFGAFSLRGSSWVPTTLTDRIDEAGKDRPCKRAKRTTEPAYTLPDGTEVPEKETYTCEDPRSINPKGVGLTRDPYFVSSIYNQVTGNPYTGRTQIPQITKFDKNAGESRDYVSPQLLVLQNVRDGTSGDVQARFKIRNAKYDPIPDLLNDFKRYSVMGVMAGDYCKTPKYANLVDINVNYFNSNEDANSYGGGEPIYSVNAGMHCNTYITDELDRCDEKVNGVYVNIPQVVKDFAREEGIPENVACKGYRCLAFCHQQSGITYENDAIYSKNFFDGVVVSRSNLHPDKPDFFCKNLRPTKGLEFQANKGDEGCVLDFVSRMKQTYANPAEIPSNYSTVVNDPRFSKTNYPVYNNNLCLNPSLDNPLDPSYKFDKSNCTRNVYEQTRVWRELQETGRTINQNLPTP